MKDSYVVRIPYCKKGFFDDKYFLNENDIKVLRDMAKEEGRSVRTLIAYKLKEAVSAKVTCWKMDGKIK